jgi:hypothetical protein
VTSKNHPFSPPLLSNVTVADLGLFPRAIPVLGRAAAIVSAQIR